MSKKVSGFILPDDVPYRQKYVCLWMDDEGKLIGMPGGYYLSAESFTKGDRQIEKKMQGAAKAYGVNEGRPYWIEGEKVSDSEYEIQQERLAAGLYPTEKEEALIAIEDEYIRRANKRTS